MFSKYLPRMSSSWSDEFPQYRTQIVGSTIYDRTSKEKEKKIFKGISNILPFKQTHNQQATNEKIVVCFVIPFKKQKLQIKKRATKSRGRDERPINKKLLTIKLYYLTVQQSPD